MYMSFAIYTHLTKDVPWLTILVIITAFVWAFWQARVSREPM
jgi:hypothetical protein